MSGGILSGILGGAIGGDQANMGTGILGSMNNYMTNNAGTLLGFGAGMLAGDNALAAQGAMQGMQQDQRTRLIQRKQAEEEQQRVAMQQAAQKLGIDPVLAQANPELVGAVAARKYTPKEISFEQQQFNQLSPGQQSQYRQQKFLGGGSNLTAQYNERRQLAEQSGLRPEHPSYQTFILTGKMPREDAQELTATDKKELWSSEDELPALEGTITALARAKELNTQTFTGRGSEIWSNLGTSELPGTGYIDQGKAKATKEFLGIMNMEAVNTMVNTLKGVTTDFELQQFKEAMADPNTPPDIRGRWIDRMTTLARRKQEIATQRVQSIGGPDYLKRRGGGGAQTPQQSSAQDAIQVDGYTIRQR